MMCPLSWRDGQLNSIESQYDNSLGMQSISKFWINIKQCRIDFNSSTRPIALKRIGYTWPLAPINTGASSWIVTRDGVQKMMSTQG